ncbi:RNA polymerase sigma factor [Nonomuraea pusilla]|uniref:RNA polymerase sigma-70 factor, ECF subfamily n=1 Tax=Nonomuraea pusilla TaxID=46177 RepID=A0A1H8IZG6_9ACTN|nr:RNA polymerase sigma factor [Nonomuraea pusilla]SEN73769.1 RNA polymerase sigma-70 factor, ECF subfamily [Nonomuraea pusilla]
MSDERLARFEAVYQETYGRVTAYAARRCASPQDAADVVAETFTVAWRRVDELPYGEEALPWLYAVARRVLANHHRGESRRRARTAELDAELADLYARSPEAEAEAAAVAQVFATLSDDDRELLALVAWEELDRPQIAAAMGLSRNAVRIRLHRARSRFARALEEAGVRHTQGNRLVPVKERLS